MPARTSCGTLIVNEQGQLLLAHVTGKRQWDIPKGAAEPGEAPVAAALRETREETGITLEPAQLRDLGRFDYMPAKDLHLFAVRLDGQALDLADCHCSSHFSDRDGRLRPEVDAFRWASEQEAATLCTPRMAAVLARALPLARGDGLKR